MKDIKSYLHLYLGCEVMAPCMSWDDEPVAKGILTGIHGEYEAEIQFIIDGNAEESPDYTKFVDVKPILRKLSSMTEEESKQARKMFSEMADNDKAQGEIWADQTRHMLSMGFDLFELIDSGLAIEKQS